MSTYCYVSHIVLIYENKCLNSICIECKNTYEINQIIFEVRLHKKLESNLSQVKKKHRE